MGKIYFMSRAYNNAATLSRCVESVLNQTKYGDQIEYWFCDNGSTDNTRELIQDYARRDPRIRVFYNDKNHEWTKQSSVYWDCPHLMKDDDFLCICDSDDFYDMNFLEKMIPFVLENDLDIGMAGSDFFDADSLQIIGRRVLPQTMLLDTPEKFAELFPQYHQFARTIWAKVYRGRVAKYMLTRNYAPPEEWNAVIRYGFDTYMLFSVLKHCDRVGIFPETLHKYQMSSKSMSYIWYSERIEANNILNRVAEEYLERFGPISVYNRLFLDLVYMNALSDSLKVLISAQGMTTEEKLRDLRKAVDHRIITSRIADEHPVCKKVKQEIFSNLLKLGLQLKQENGDFKAVLGLVCPNCAPHISADDVELYIRDVVLNDILFKDNLPELSGQISYMSAKYMNTAKKFSNVPGS